VNDRATAGSRTTRTDSRPIHMFDATTGPKLLDGREAQDDLVRTPTGFTRRPRFGLSVMPSNR
jgi:hypothetical protein